MSAARRRWIVSLALGAVLVGLLTQWQRVPEVAARIRMQRALEANQAQAAVAAYRDAVRWRGDADRDLLEQLCKGLVVCELETPGSYEPALLASQGTRDDGWVSELLWSIARRDPVFVEARIDALGALAARSDPAAIAELSAELVSPGELAEKHRLAIAEQLSRANAPAALTWARKVLADLAPANDAESKLQLAWGTPWGHTPQAARARSTLGILRRQGAAPELDALLDRFPLLPQQVRSDEGLYAVRLLVFRAVGSIARREGLVDEARRRVTNLTTDMPAQRAIGLAFLGDPAQSKALQEDLERPVGGLSLLFALDACDPPAAVDQLDGYAQAFGSSQLFIPPELMDYLLDERQPPRPAPLLSYARDVLDGRLLSNHHDLRYAALDILARAGTDDDLPRALTQLESSEMRPYAAAAALRILERSR